MLTDLSAAVLSPSTQLDSFAHQKIRLAVAGCRGVAATGHGGYFAHHRVRLAFGRAWREGGGVRIARTWKIHELYIEHLLLQHVLCRGRERNHKVTTFRSRDLLSPRPEKPAQPRTRAPNY